MKQQPRGIRNNNPGNINKGIGFQGEVAGKDSRFATFASPEMGIRALTKNLMTYDRKYGLNTPQGIINRWAPPNENNTNSYVNVVSKALGVAPNTKLNMRDPATMAKLASVIIQHENGKNPYSMEQINAGVNMALGSAPTPRQQPAQVAQAAQPQRQPGLIERAVNAMVPAAQAAQPQAFDYSKLSDDELIALINKNDSTYTQPTPAPAAFDYSKLSDDELIALIGGNKSNQPAAQAPEPQPTAQAQGNAEDGGFWDGVWMGIRDPIDAGAQMLSRSLDDTAVGRGINQFGDWLGNETFLGDWGLVAKDNSVQGVDKLINDVNSKYEAGRVAAGRDGFDFARLGGNIGMTLPITARNPTAITSLFGRMGVGAAQGAGFGLLQPVIGEDKQANFWSEKGKQAALGGLLGAATPPITAGIGRLLSPKASRTGSAVRGLLDEGVELTPGQALGGTALRIEDKLMSVPIMGDAIRSARNRGNESLNRAVYNRVLKPIGQKTDKLGREAVDDVAIKISDAYDDVLSKVIFKPDAGFKADMQILKDIADKLPTDEAIPFLKMVAREIEEPLSKGVGIDGITFKQIESELGKNAQRYLRASSVHQQNIGHGLKEAQTALRNALERSNPAQAARLQSINQAYTLQTLLQDAAGRLGANGGKFTPSQLLSAVRSGDKTIRHNGFARGNALMQDLADAARTHMNSQIPNSGTAERLMLNTGAIGAGSYSSAIPLSLAAGAVPYLPHINRATTGLLTSRPEIAHSAAKGLNALPPGLFSLLGDYRN